jgi:hypothetical protein
MGVFFAFDLDSNSPSSRSLLNSLDLQKGHSTKASLKKPRVSKTLYKGKKLSPQEKECLVAVAVVCGRPSSAITQRLSLLLSHVDRLQARCCPLPPPCPSSACTQPHCWDIRGSHSTDGRDIITPRGRVSVSNYIVGLRGCLGRNYSLGSGK